MADDTNYSIVFTGLLCLVFMVFGFLCFVPFGILIFGPFNMLLFVVIARRLWRGHSRL